MTLSLEAVLERYMGKSRKLVEAERYLDKLVIDIERMYKNNEGNIIHKANTSPHLLKVADILKKEMNIRALDLVFIHTKDPNAFTIPKAVNLRDPRKDKDMLKETMYINVTLTIGLITRAKMTGGELMASILHELGHNFYKSYLHTIYMTHTWIQMEPAQLIGSLALSQSGIASFVSTKIRDYKSRAISYFSLVRQITELWSDVLNVINALVPKSLYIVPSAYHAMMNPVAWVSRYNIEKHADNFATDYGYGPELVSSQRKFDAIFRNENNPASYIYDIPALGIIYELDTVAYMFASGVVGLYPSSNKRIAISLNRLEKYSNDPTVPKELRNQAKRDVDNIKRYLEAQSKLSEAEKRVILSKYLEATKNATYIPDVRDALELIDFGNKI